MMKKISFFILIIISTTGYSQTNEILKIEEVVKTEALISAKDLFNRSNYWYYKNFGDSKNVNVILDSSNFVLSSVGKMRFNSKIFLGNAYRSGWITYDFSISCKEGRYKYEFLNFHLKSQFIDYGIITIDPILSSFDRWKHNSSAFRKKITSEVHDFIRLNIYELTTSLNIEMNKTPIAKEDW